MCEAGTLRRFVTERLAAASRDILAAVERTVAGYEEQIDRQRRQLDLLLQPHVKLSAPGVKRSRNLSPAEDEEGEDEESPEHLDPTAPPRSLFHPSQYGGRKSGRPQISATQNHVDLRIRILEDYRTSVLSKYVLKKCPVLNLKCPRGLREDDFLDLLRSTFPLLSGHNRPFDILTSDKRRRLQPVKLKAVTPEEIQRNISGCGKCTVYIRLKRQEEPQGSEEEIRPLQTKTDVPAVSSDLLTCEETGQQTSSRVQEVGGGGADVVSTGSTSQQQDVETEEAGREEPASDSVAHSATEQDDRSEGDEKEEERDEANDSDSTWKPGTSDEGLKKRNFKLPSKITKKPKVGHSGVGQKKSESSVAAVSCRVCGELQKSDVTLVQHAWSHEDHPGLVCGVCGERSESVEVLKDHLRSLHKTDDCHICGESFVDTLSYNEHVAAHTTDRTYKCDVCHAAFALKVSLDDHQKLHEVGKLHKCYTCHKVFELVEQLKTHRRTHISRKTHLCGVCGKSLSDYRSLSRHKMTHSGERPHSCEICGRRFKLPGTLRQHEKIHTNRERSYLCDVCCKMFLTSKQLQIHMRAHTNEKPYHCGECGKGFTTKGPLTVHMRVHTGETPYRCPDCGWSFKRKSNLDNHVAVHSGIKPFICGICGKACARKTHLTVHMRTHNGERPYKCSLCDKAFTQSHCLKTHMRSHQGAESATSL